MKLVNKGFFEFNVIATKGGAIRNTKTTKTPASETEEVTVTARREKKRRSLRNPLTLG